MPQLTQPTPGEINYAIGLLKAQRNNEAIDFLSRLNRRHSLSVPVIQLLSNAYIAISDYKLAINEYVKLVKIDAYNTTVLKNLGTMYFKNGEPEQALNNYFRAMEIAPNDPEIYYKIGNLYFETNNLNLAIDNYEVAIKLRPNFFNALYNLGNIFLTLKNFQKSVEVFKKCLVINPNHTGMLGNLGIALLEFGKVEESIEIFTKLNQLAPSAVAKEYLGRALLLKRQFNKGWEYYEARLDDVKKYPVFLKQKAIANWNGEKGKDVFLCLEQGIGDQIMFLSLAKEAQKLCKSLTILVDERIREICNRSLPNIKFIATSEELDAIDFDYQLPIGSLPKLFRNNEIDFQKQKIGYFRANQSYAEHLKKKLKLHDAPLIGISWASFNCINSDKKSIALKNFRNVLVNFNCDIINLQYGNVDKEVEEFTNATNLNFINNHGVDVYNDIEGLAALIEICDLIITIPNVTVQLSGALGKKGWVIVPFSPNFNWTIDTATSLWYPNINIYRQKKINDWTEVLTELESEALNYLDIFNNPKAID